MTLSSLSNNIQPHENPPFFTALILATGLCSCASNDDFEKRLQKRNSSYSDYNDRREIRLDARQERTDMWFDRVMQ